MSVRETDPAERQLRLRCLYSESLAPLDSLEKQTQPKGNPEPTRKPGDAFDYFANEIY